ncbi:hypothetical protein PAPYR_8383 [Paratrimastix pyriformis]|uniref:Uncharacterized protein n=1 Tax=Paratrimastix pyriformis TaxID=342808 RepID=A0ABQ8UAT9_9EUKA|nr:hypothetical protein PAPYR_8383 [Paratrimastix pyriformis]
MHGPADGNHRSRKDCGRAFGIERIRDGMKTDGVVEDHQSTFNVGEMFGEFASERLFLDEQLQQTGFDRAWSIGLAAAFAATAGKTRRPVRSDGPIGSPQSRSELCRRGRFWCRPQRQVMYVIHGSKFWAGTRPSLEDSGADVLEQVNADEDEEDEEDDEEGHSHSHSHPGGDDGVPQFPAHQRGLSCTQ